MMRLNKYLARQGLCSRREADVWIRNGRIGVNRALCTDLGIKVNPAADRICLDRKTLSALPRHEYILYNKPKGCVVSSKGQKSRTIYDLQPHKLPYVGRLDKETSGLLLLTNDGELSFRLTHPKHHIDKHYLATVSGKVTRSEVQQLRKGIVLEDGKTRPARVRVISSENGPTQLRICIREGKNRLLRRMFSALGHRTLALHREGLGRLRLGKLAGGEYRPLFKAELASLRKEAGL